VNRATVLDIVIPVYNERANIRKTLQSIAPPESAPARPCHILIGAAFELREIAPGVEPPAGTPKLTGPSVLAFADRPAYPRA